MESYEYIPEYPTRIRGLAQVLEIQSFHVGSSLRHPLKYALMNMESPIVQKTVKNPQPAASTLAVIRHSRAATYDRPVNTIAPE